MLNVGIIGLGIGKKHLEAFNSHENCKVIAVCDFDSDLLETVSKEQPELKTFKDANDILNNDQIDIVSIASYDNYHTNQILTAFSQNKHVFVEKPFCLDQAEMELIYRAFNNADRAISSNLALRAVPRFRWLREKIEVGYFGKIYYLEGDYLWGRVFKLTEGWRNKMPFYSIIYGAAIHLIDLICWFLPGARVTEVSTFGNKIVTSNTDFRFDDFAVILLKFSNGIIAKVSGNGGCAHPHFHRVTVYGNQKTFISELDEARVIHLDDGRIQIDKVTEDYPGNRKNDIIYSFVDSIIDHRKKALVPAKDMFDSMSVCLAANESLQTGKTVQVRYC
jgi:predicted dehydrogenase